MIDLSVARPVAGWLNWPYNDFTTRMGMPPHLYKYGGKVGERLEWYNDL